MKINEHQAVYSLDDFIHGGAEVGKQGDEEKRGFFGDKVLPLGSALHSSTMANLKVVGPSVLSSLQLRKRLEKVLHKSLLPAFVIPDLVEGLTEFLTEVVQEDPGARARLGIP